MTTDSPSILFAVASTDDEFKQILNLQQENLHHNLSRDLQLQLGFVFAEHTLPILKSMAARLPQIIALNNDRVVGYNLAMSSEMRNELPSLAPMFDEFDKCVYRGKQLSDYKFVIGGQVCVDKNFRGLGLMSKLYKVTANHLPKDYELCVTEISRRNTKSLQAHQKMGFEVIADYDDGSEHWNIVAWEL